MNKIIYSIALVIAYMAIAYFVPMFGLAPLVNALIIGVLLVALSKIVFTIYDKNNAPKNLTMDEVKSFFSSKIFWLSLFTFVASTAKGLFGIDIDVDTQTEILNLDWTNVIPALGAVLIIAVRKFDILKLLIG